MKKIAVINGLRGYAILSVTYFHLLGAFVTLPGYRMFSLGGIHVLPFTFLSNGWLGVNLFFVLSGFVLYLPYAKGERQMRQAGDVKAYYTGRARRLFPLYYVALFVSVFFVLRQNNIHQWDFWRQLLLLLSFTFNFSKETYIPSCNYVLWSLGIEVLFSAVLPLLLMLIRKRGVYSFFAAALFVGFTTRCIALCFPEYRVAPHLNMVKDSLPGRLDDFAVGMLACHWFVHGWKQDWFEKHAVQLCGTSMVVLGAGCCLSDYVFLHFAPGHLEPFINTVVQLGTGMLCLSLLYMKSNGLRYLFVNRAIQLSGMMCYSLYVWHGNLRWFFVIDYTALRICSYLVFLFLFSFLTYRYIEFGDRKFRDILPE